MLSLCYSPCPNDTFIFDAMIHGKVDTEGLSFEVELDDVEALNRRAFSGTVDITKLSYHAFAYLTDKFDLLDAGSALGNNCGPLLIAREPLTEAQLIKGPVAIPGKMTTANFLLSLAYPAVQNKHPLLFSEIEDAVACGDAVAGLIIHENRFTYQKRGLVQLIDLGAFWETKTEMPIPLGGIVVRRDLPKATKQSINRVLRRSVEFALANPESVMSYVRQHAQAMDDAVMQAHIALYVTDFTVDLGEKGRATVRHLFQVAREKQIIPNYNKDFFIN